LCCSRHFGLRHILAHSVSPSRCSSPTTDQFDDASATDDLYFTIDQAEGAENSQQLNPISLQSGLDGVDNSPDSSRSSTPGESRLPQFPPQIAPIEDPPVARPESAVQPSVENLGLRADPLIIPPLPVRIPPLESYAGSHGKWYIRAILLLAACLHTKHHITFRASNIMLYTLRLIFKSLNLLEIDDDMPTTLNTVLKRLDLQDRFTILPACPQCHRHFPPKSATSVICTKCNIPLFSMASHTLFQRLLGREPSTPPPKLSVPVAPLSEQLIDFLARPMMEHIVEDYRDRKTAPEELNCIMDGRVWNEIEGPDGKPFFDKASLTEPNEIRLGVTFAVDW